MKKHSTELFELVKTMSPSESRYFVVYSKRHFTKDTHYLLVYQYLRRANEYDENALLVHFKNERWHQHFAVIKKQLYYTILESLHQYNEYASLEQQIKKGIHFCSLLLNKGLFTQCQKMIYKYKDQAQELEKHEYLLELIELEKKLITRAFINEENDEYINRVEEEEKQSLEQIRLSAKYWKQSSIIYKLHYQKKISVGHPGTELQKLLQNKDFKDFTNAKTCKAKLDFLQINALHSFLSRDTLKAFEYNKKFLDYLDDNVKMRTIHADRYFSVLNNYLIDSLILKKHSVLLKGIRQLREISTQPAFKHISNIEANVFRLSTTLELNYYISQQLFSEGIQIIDQIEAGIIKYKNKIVKPSIITIQYLVAYVLFFTKNFTKCLDYLDEILKDKQASSIKDIYRDARILQLLCHYELKNFSLLESLIISFQRFMIKEKITYQTYRVVLKFLNASMKPFNKDKRSKFRTEIELLQNDSKESVVFNNFNYSLWLSLK